MGGPRPYIIAENNWKSIKKTGYSLAVLPWGATEAHNFHLPYATDNILSESVAIESAKLAWENGVRLAVLPTVPYGVNTGQMDIKLCMNINPSTQFAILKDIVQVLDFHEIHKLVIINGHGGNDFKQMIRELSLNFPKVFVCALNWWRSLDANIYFEEPGDHAGELETSVMMHISSELVLPLMEAGSGSAKSFKLKGLKQGWVKAQRKWTEVTEDTGVGNPRNANPGKGKLFFQHSVKNISEFLEELYHSDMEDFYE
ncbi:creatininase family protein [Arenibacter sp. M-2]|uniref:creatininase family protein n=1 Tax=Arenibacter sp. M-2 TaxID=3053612 RepID=UPI002570DE6D|nr:creatininase family protein [Arenibacter sp. M-2]MDL5510502.1 creatininase family protein [Arenibacter sp. M-2]